MANVKFNEQTFYVPSEKFLIGVKETSEVYKNSSLRSSTKGSVQKGQVFSVSSEANGLFRIKSGWINKENCEILLESSHEIKTLSESFVVKVISNIPTFTEPSVDSHTTTVLRVGDLQRVIGESGDFFKLEHGGFIEKRGCSRY